ncbi:MULTISPECIES: DUF5518 domain-containing protein [Methanobacterium]|uniref:DUF5518 domain-containing protein n=1 Tax=Methanobacterium bryantii TaxID=2161 RepID=A0A2A2H2S7_METBR|nr:MULTISPECIES: DUF5518 domain-containing protein [Methanobacterium]OEC87670.1 hypothetical protein A9507_00220 [Methanobacterium sp. A39]PAV03692.1 hypothetical protein ASJ80_01630 [Methanobacterium bryantii]
MDDWKSVILGSIIALILSLVLARNVIGGLMAGIIGFLIAGLMVGYLTDIEIEHISIIGHLTSSNTKNAAINGAVAGFIGGLIFVLIGTVTNSFIYPVGTNRDLLIMFIAGGVPVAVIASIFYGVICAVGGVIGVFIKRSRPPKESTA